MVFILADDYYLNGTQSSTKMYRTMLAGHMQVWFSVWIKVLVT